MQQQTVGATGAAYNVATHSVDLSKDRAWLTAYRAGDRAALERVFRAYAPLVFHVLKGGAHGAGPFVAGIQDQDDLAQEVFLKLFGDGLRQRYDGVRPFSALVRSVTRNTLVDHLRKRGRLKEDPVEDLEKDLALDHWAPGQPMPDRALLDRERQQQATALWETLDTEEKGLAKVRYQDGLSQRDAAELLGISRQNLRTLEGRLRAKMDAFVARWTQGQPGVSDLQPKSPPTTNTST